MGSNRRSLDTTSRPSLHLTLASILLLLLIFASREAHLRVTKEHKESTTSTTTKAPSKHDKLESQLKELLGDDKLTKSILKYLDEVPSSHKTPSHATRSFSSTGAQFSTELNGQRRLGDLLPKAIQDTLSLLFSQGPIKCPSCQRCPKDNIVPDPKATDEACPQCKPCPLPDYCKPAELGQGCPPKPNCPECGDDPIEEPSPSIPRPKYIPTPSPEPTTEPFPEPTTEPAVSTTTSKPSSKSGEPSSTTGRPSSTTGGPPSTTGKPSSTTGKPSSTTGGPSSTTGRPSSTTGKPSSTTGKPSSTTGKPSSTTGKPSSTTGGPSSTTGRPSSTTGKPSSTTGGPSSTTGKPSSTTGKPSSTTATSTPPSLSTTTDRPQSTTTTSTSAPSPSILPRSKTTTAEPSSTPTATTTTRSPSLNSSPNNPKVMEQRQTASKNSLLMSRDKDKGSLDYNLMSNKMDQMSLFDRNIQLLMKNEESKKDVLKIIDSIPSSIDFDDMKLAREMLDKFREHGHFNTSAHSMKNESGPNKRTAHTRFFNIVTGKDIIKKIIDCIMDLFIAKHCDCKKCEPAKPKNRPCKKCPPCARIPNCPFPEGCPKYPCRPCSLTEPNLFDSLRAWNSKKNPFKVNKPRFGGNDNSVVSYEELARPIKCRGFTCAFERICGVANMNRLSPMNSQSGYMNGGEDEIYGEWPSFARLSIRFPNGGESVCGGVLISNRHVLTAGHCVHDQNRGVINPATIVVVLGEHDKRIFDKFEQQVGVERICLSRKYDDGSGTRYDFAVLTLKSYVRLTDYVQPACLPYNPISVYLANPQSSKIKCFVPGTGIIKFNRNVDKNHQWSPIVQKMALAQTSCRNWGFKDTDRSRHCFTKPHSAGDTCGGDSGGPILCLHPKTKRWTIVGLVSYGSEACDGSDSYGWVGVYTRVTTLLQDMQNDCGI